LTFGGVTNISESGEDVEDDDEQELRASAAAAATGE
jgi:hypothetical protein